MSKQRRGTDGGSPSDVAGVLRDLATRERQLRDLTEQSLGFLEELAEARRLNGEREQLVVRLSQLERMLADAKNRLRSAGGAAPDAPPKGQGKKTRRALEVVFHGAPSRDAAVAAAAAIQVPVSWIGLPDAVSAAGAPKQLTTITNRDARTLAQCWNLGMAATAADAVLFLGPGVDLRVTPELPSGIPANAALLSPRIDREGTSELGCEPADELLRLRPRAAGSADEAVARVPWASADAFLVRRAAFEQIGAFDEGLTGPAALLEYTLRMRRANFDVLGVPGVAVVGARRDDAAETTAAARERLVVIAAHRPDLLGQALADAPILWQLDRADAPGWLAQLMARLPGGDGSPEQRAMLERVALGLVQHGLPLTRVRSLLLDARLALLQGFADAGTVTARGEFTAAVRRAEAHRGADPGSVFAALGNDVVLCRDAAAATARALEQTRVELRAIDAQRHEQSSRAERAEGARQHAQAQLEQVQQWLRENQTELQRTQEARAHALLRIEEIHRGAARVAEELGEVKRHRQSLEVQLQEVGRAVKQVEAQLQESQRARQQAEAQLQESQRVRQQVEAQLQESQRVRQQVEAQLQESQRANEQAKVRLQDSQRANEQLDKRCASERAVAQQTQQRLDGALQQHRELEREYLATDTELRAVRDQMARIAGVLGVVADAHPSSLQQRLEVVHEQAQQLGAALRSAGAADAAGLLQRLDDLGQRLASTEQVVHEREKWIAILLQEVAQRRLFPRPLQPHEQAIVDRAGRTS